MHREITLDTETKAQRAIKIYNKLSLKLYDAHVHGFVAPAIFKYPTSNVLKLYNRKLVKCYNSAGVFNNLHDDLNGLNQALQRNFANVEIHFIGYIAVFRASDGELT